MSQTLSAQPTFKFTCDPRTWTISEWYLFARYFESGDLAIAARLARMGVQLRKDELAETPDGVELAGKCLVDVNGSADILSFSDDLHECLEDCDDGIVEVASVYRGPTKYAVIFNTEDDGRQIELCDTREAAVRFAKGLYGEAA